MLASCEVLLIQNYLIYIQKDNKSSPGAVVGIPGPALDFEGALWARTGTLQSYCLLWAPTGNGNQVISGNQKSDSPFSFFFPFSLLFFLIHQSLNDFHDISLDRWSAQDVLLAPIGRI